MYENSVPCTPKLRFIVELRKLSRSTIFYSLLSLIRFCHFVIHAAILSVLSIFVSVVVSCLPVIIPAI